MFVPFFTILLASSVLAEDIVINDNLAKEEFINRIEELYDNEELRNELVAQQRALGKEPSLDRLFGCFIANAQSQCITACQVG